MNADEAPTIVVGHDSSDAARRGLACMRDPGARVAGARPCVEATDVLRIFRLRVATTGPDRQKRR